MSISRMVKRFFRRIKSTTRIDEMYRWEFESCDRCGGLH